MRGICFRRCPRRFFPRRSTWGGRSCNRCPPRWPRFSHTAASTVTRTQRLVDATVRARGPLKAAAAWASAFTEAAGSASRCGVHPDRAAFPPLQPHPQQQQPQQGEVMAYYQISINSMSFFNPAEARLTGRGGESAGSGLPNGACLVLQALALHGDGDAVCARYAGLPKRVPLEEVGSANPFFFTVPYTTRAAISIAVSIPCDRSPTGAAADGWGFVNLPEQVRESDPPGAPYVCKSVTLTLYYGTPQALLHLPFGVLAQQVTAVSPKKTVGITVAQYFVHETGAVRHHQSRICDRVFPLCIESVANPPSGLICLNDAKAGEALTGAPRTADGGSSLRRFNPARPRCIADLSVLDMGVGGLRRFCFQLELRQFRSPPASRHSRHRHVPHRRSRRNPLGARGPAGPPLLGGDRRQPQAPGVCAQHAETPLPRSGDLRPPPLQGWGRG